MIELFVWPAFGALAGWIVWLLSGFSRQPWGSVIAGVAGAIVGGIIVITAHPTPLTGANIGSLFGAIAGAVAVAAIYLAVGGRTD